MTFLYLNTVHGYNILHKICRPDFTKNKDMVAIFVILVMIFKSFRGYFSTLFLVLKIKKYKIEVLFQVTSIETLKHE